MPAKILVVDDDGSIRRLIGHLLQRHGLQFEFAENGAEALELVRRTVFEAVLLDLMMPTMNGFDFLDVVRLEKPELLARTIVVTAFSRQGHPPAVDGVFAVIRKPFDIDNLLDVVDLCLESKQ
ncbi:MAG TPA: response regulator [Thermoanaerobaculia bacterium]|nr:response regulator [Thermoanaerobaculia bacterium]